MYMHTESVSTRTCTLQYTAVHVHLHMMFLPKFPVYSHGNGWVSRHRHWRWITVTLCQTVQWALLEKVSFVKHKKLIMTMKIVQ